MKKFILLLVALLIVFPAAARTISSFETKVLNPDFSEAEKNWLQNNPRIEAVVLNNAPPYEYLDKEGRFQGLASSYLHIIENSTGIKFKIIAVENWKEAFSYLDKHPKTILPWTARKNLYNHHILYSKSYLSSSLGIFSRQNTAYVNNLDDIVGQKIAIDRQTRQYFKDLQDVKHNFVVFDNPKDALLATENGKVDFYIGDILFSKFAIDSLELRQLRYIAPVVGSAYTFGLGLTPGNDTLLAIINKVLSQIDPEMHLEIREKWASVHFGNEEILMKKYWRYLYITIGGAILLLLLILYRNHLQRQKAEKLSQSQKMESIGRLAGGVAHDFNNMLAGIHGAAEVMDIQLARDSELHKYIEIIRSACERAAHLTAQLLVFSRKKEQRVEVLDMHECIEESLYLLEHGISKKIKITSELQARNFHICGNRDLLQSMLLNLAFNAKDAMDDGGEFRVSTKNVILNRDVIKQCMLAVKPGEYIEVAVADNGSGIPDNIKNKIFEPFFTTKEVGKGTGLGLSAVYGIVSDLRGTLYLDTGPQGTTFYIYFPVTAADKPKHEGPVALQSVNARVLVVDDEKILLEVMKEILKSVGAEPMTVEDSSKAVDVYRSGRFDLVMLDVLMPGQSGIDVYHVLRQISSDIKIVFMSGYSRDNDLEDIIETDSQTDFIAKPYKIAEVVEKLSKMLETK